MEIGFVHPPLGMNLYVIQGIAPDVPLGRVFKGVVPFLAADLVHLVLLVVFPGDRAGPAAMAGEMSMRPEMQLVDRLLEDPLAGREGGIGFVGADLPIDLFAATGRGFGHLPWRSAGPTPWADRWLESGFPQWTRYLLEDWHAGRFDLLSKVVFSRADDASQRLYYYVRELQSRGQLAGPAPLIFDIALLPRATSLAHTVEALRGLAREFDVDTAQLVDGIARVNVLRRRLSLIQAARDGDGAVYERLARAALFSDATTWIDHFKAPAAAMKPRVLLAGSVPPDDRLHCAVEAAGAAVVAEAHVHGLTRLREPLTVERDEPWHSLARHLRANSVAPRSVIDRSQWLVAEAIHSRAGAVVLWLTREEEGLAWHVPAQRRALQEAGVPCLALTVRRWHADDGALAEIADFCRGKFA